jgi:hypothetical protein
MAAGYGPGKTGGDGLVLVFDLDQTLIDTKAVSKVMSRTDDVIEAALNDRIIGGILGPANTFRTAYPGSIDAILLLTNNSSQVYVSNVCKIIARKLGHTGRNFRNIQSSENARFKAIYPLFFDYIMMIGTPRRAGSSEKSLNEVRIMLDALKIKDDDLEKRTFFFDDQEHAKMRRDIGDSHYIKIIGPDVDPMHPEFNWGFRQGKDNSGLTNYEPILEELRKISANSANTGPPNFGNDDEALSTTSVNGAAVPKLPENSQNSVVGGRRRTQKRKYKKRKTIRRR